MADISKFCPIIVRTFLSAISPECFLRIYFDVLGVFDSVKNLEKVFEIMSFLTKLKVVVQGDQIGKKRLAKK